MKKLQYQHTRRACYLGYVTQAAVNNLPPLLFVTFQREFHVSVEAIAALISINFGIQLVTDLIAVRMIDKIGYRIAALASHILAFAGLVSLGILPYCISSYLGLCIAMGVNAIGGGLAEVIISPIVESLPGDRKASSMSLLHAFYCWGHVGVILFSTLYFVAIGTEYWRFLPMLWALVPLLNIFLFAHVPLCSLQPDGTSPAPVSSLFRQSLFWVLLCLMLCSGAAEQAMAQWASWFAESGLHVSKTLGDLMGPCAFAACMGISRTFYGICGHRIDLNRALMISGICCAGCYLLTVFSPWPLLALAGCAFCGLTVGLMWPGVTSLAAKQFPQAGTAMFALLALAGDLGCASGPGFAGFISGYVVKNGGGFFEKFSMVQDGGLRAGLFAVTIFPVMLFVFLWILQRKKSNKKEIAL